MPLHHESVFKTEICEYLGANGWLYAEGDAAGYDRARALYPADVVAWVQERQPKARQGISCQGTWRQRRRLAQGPQDGTGRKPGA